MNASSPTSGSTNVKIIDRVTVSFNRELDLRSIHPDSFSVVQNGSALSGNLQSYGNTVLFFPTQKFSYNTDYSVTVRSTVMDKSGKRLGRDIIFTFRTEQSPDAAPVQLVSSSPTNGDTGISAFSPITLIFNKTLNVSTVNSSTITVTCGGITVYGNFEIQDTLVRFVPSSNLLTSSSCTFSLSTGIRDSFGNPLDKNYSISFSTVDNVPPYIISLNPAGGSLGHSINSPIQVVFSESIDMSTVNSSSFSVTSSSGSVSGTFSFSSNTLTFTPSIALVKKRVYTVSLSTSISDVNGNPLPLPYMYKFTTEISPMIAAGHSHVCALSRQGRIKCWGNNVYGQTGQRDDVYNVSAPYEIMFDTPVREISAGYYSTCALFSNFKLKCWGYNGTGAIGYEQGIGRDPLQNQYVATADTPVSIATNIYNTCIISSNLKVYCWGQKVSSGLDFSVSAEVTLKDPLILPDLNLGTNSIALSVGNNGTTCAFFNSGRLKCWGLKDMGQIGLTMAGLSGFSSYVYPASSVSDYDPQDGLNIKTVSVGAAHTCSFFTNGNFKCWGYNPNGEIFGAPIGVIVNGAVNATLYDLGAGAIQLLAGYGETYGVDAGGTVYYWGKNSGGSINSIPLLSPALSVTSGIDFGCAVLNTEQIQCWGKNEFGQLGIGSNINGSFSVPAAVITVF